MILSISSGCGVSTRKVIPVGKSLSAWTFIRSTGLPADVSEGCGKKNIKAAAPKEKRWGVTTFKEFNWATILLLGQKALLGSVQFERFLEDVVVQLRSAFGQEIRILELRLKVRPHY